MKPALVILAAGESRRLGTCKALVDLGGRSPLARLLEAGRAMDGTPPLVVTGAHDAVIRAAVPAGVEVLFNPEWPSGRTSGIALASRSRPDFDLTIAPVDVPLVPAEVFATLRAEWLRLGFPAKGWLGPFVDQRDIDTPYARFGHPIVVGRELLRELAGGKDFPDPAAEVPITTLRELRLRAAETFSVHVASPRILDDLDTEADLARLRALVS